MLLSTYSQQLYHHTNGSPVDLYNAERGHHLHENQYEQASIMPCKIAIVGNSGVGKSSIISRLIHNEFNPDSKPTIGVQISRHDVEIDDKHTTVRLCDTAGLERYRAPSPGAYLDVAGAMVVFDLSNELSFEHAELWLRELRDHASKEMMVMLVGNKSDLQPLRRTVDVARAAAFARENDMAFLEVSALSGQNVELALQTLVTCKFFPALMGATQVVYANGLSSYLR
jgi:small GTP-binding protein